MDIDFGTVGRRVSCARPSPEVLPSLTLVLGEAAPAHASITAQCTFVPSLAGLIGRSGTRFVDTEMLTKIKSGN